MEEQKSNRRVLTGVVVSDKADKTIVVMVETLVKHPLYKKYIRRRKKFMAHDPQNDCGIGDTVSIIEHRPLSARKRWHLEKIMEKAV
ncbi:MAG: 30S ribosomal protein S17 [Solidesulfovibrio magneticus str. Maddingley MBC34]|jgi:small subunit ribosomal protein S17|uniref:Small ribosomal subunit protein uS17 n=1 Tax=Solidesulfovibrio magneticus str. Maddingley MBC34 TaxID=1206767 RepID=K6GPU3_9BACT|nr:MAG: 30S ribosomal protein S17 [Solidesulfovibrio magneticus str. Maddingley MBC34]HML54375.1 30S ribosomal protein S17 [Solidesulfovibrio magneticus]